MSRADFDEADFARLARERDADHFHDECGVFAVHGHSEAAHLTYLGLYALQHRGQESAGIVSSDRGEQFAHRSMGLVADVFSENMLRRLPGRHAIGHVRYSTSGGSAARNAQPFCATTDAGPVALAHNGNLVNAPAIRRELEGRGSIFGTTADSEVIVHLLARSREGTLEERLIDALSRVKGAFSLVMLTQDALIAVRDPYGFRPLTLGRLDGAWVVASETCALDLIGASFERDLQAGEVVVIRRGRLRSLRPFTRPAAQSFCIFEHIYFARPDSNLLGHNVYEFRKELGRILAREHPVAADMVVPVLDSGNAAALGYAEESGIPYETALTRNQYVKRTFIEPLQSVRDFRVKVKHNAMGSFLRGKRVILVEDSIVRGTTCGKIVSMYGIDTPTREELIAAKHTPEEIRAILGADSLGYLSLEGLRGLGGGLKHGICDACFSDEYPIATGAPEKAPQLSLFREVEREPDSD
jgi:amidophosphoribosyltransferase